MRAGSFHSSVLSPFLPGRRLRVACVALLFAAFVGCGSEAPKAPDAPPRPGSQPKVAESLRKDLAAERSASDGGGRAVLDPPGPVRIGEMHRFRFEYEAGPLGIEEGGALFFQVSPFFGWSKIQLGAPELAGYTTFSTSAEGVRLEPGRVDNPYLLPIAVRGRALRAGERIEVVYGAGERKAQVDRFAERGERFWFHVDGDGDGVRGIVLDSPTLDVLPGPPARLVLSWPATARPGETVTLTAALLDRHANRVEGGSAVVTLLDRPPGLGLPESIEILPSRAGVGHAEVQVGAEGIVRVRGRVEAAGEGGALEAESNPMLVMADVPRVLWADLHGHTNWSDGTGHPEDYLAYARDVAGLDVVALTDHDHWGTPFFDASPDRWKETQALTERFHAPGRFVTVLGFEWTNWIYGHRHVLYFDSVGEVLSSVDPATERPDQLWAALQGKPAMTIAHHPAGGPVSIDWSFPPDPVLEPVTEIVSGHGSSEAPDSPTPIYDAIPGDWVRDQLAKGALLGFVGSGDSHDGHPGYSQFMSVSGGLAAIFSEERTREGVFEALRARRTYATNGARILLRASLGGRRMGETLSIVDLAKAAAAMGDVQLTVQAIGTGPIEKIEVIHGREVVERLDGEGRREILTRWSVPPLDMGQFLYVRVVQKDGGAAWSSPWFVTE
ncbi:MAG: CehA/McbA family metallohydrolase [Myxococcota bacterium]|nr:CehA/McbA family metallohydrolase [Myxococcota bacterium]